MSSEYDKLVRAAASVYDGQPRRLDLVSRNARYRHRRIGPGIYAVGAPTGADLVSDIDGKISHKSADTVVVRGSIEVTYHHVQPLLSLKIGDNVRRGDRIATAAPGNAYLYGNFDRLNNAVKFTGTQTDDKGSASTPVGNMPSSAQPNSAQRAGIAAVTAVASGKVVAAQKSRPGVEGVERLSSNVIAPGYKPGRGVIPGSHAGLDFGVRPRGVKGSALAITDGIIAAKYYSPTYGNVVVLRGALYDYLYAHLASPSPLAVGTRVSTGAVLGTVGNTGRPVTANIDHMEIHLHLERRPHGSSYPSRATPESRRLTAELKRELW